MLKFLFWFFIGAPLLFLAILTIAAIVGVELNAKTPGCHLLNTDDSGNTEYSCPTKNGYELFLVSKGRIIKK